MSNPLHRIMASVAFFLGSALLIAFPGHAQQPAPQSQAAQVAGATAIRFAPEKDYGPFVFEDASGQIRGLSVDILNAIAKNQGLHIVNLPPQNLGTILDAARRGEVDLISSLKPTPERLTFLNFSRPYVEIPAVLICLAESEQGLSLQNFVKQTVAVGKGYGVESFVREKYPSVQWLAVADDMAALQAIESGIAKAAVIDLASYHYNLKKFKKDQFLIQGRVGFEYPLSFAYPKDKPEIGQLIERGLSQFSVTQREAMVRRWVGSESNDYIDSRTGWLIKIALAGLLIALALAFVALLKKNQTS
jgi:ABC-type amino acid transport substrate-binding protein